MQDLVLLALLSLWIVGMMASLAIGTYLYESKRNDDLGAALCLGFAFWPLFIVLLPAAILGRRHRK